MAPRHDGACVSTTCAVDAMPHYEIQVSSIFCHITLSEITGIHHQLKAGFSSPRMDLNFIIHIIVAKHILVGTYSLNTSSLRDPPDYLKIHGMWNY